MCDGELVKSSTSLRFSITISNDDSPVEELHEMASLQEEMYESLDVNYKPFISCVIPKKVGDFKKSPCEVNKYLNLPLEGSAKIKIASRLSRSAILPEEAAPKVRKIKHRKNSCSPSCQLM